MSEEEIKALIAERDALLKEKEERTALDEQLKSLEERLTEKFTAGQELPEPPENTDPLESLIKNIFNKEQK